MIPCKTVKVLQKERGASLHFPVTHLISPTIFEMSNMMLGSVIYLKGVAFFRIISKRR